jgi:hypothetical protein
LAKHANKIRNGTLQCREEWDELVASIELPDKSIHHIQWKDVKLWIHAQTDDDI